jgi:hypothetical protein
MQYGPRRAVWHYEIKLQMVHVKIDNNVLLPLGDRRRAVVSAQICNARREAPIPRLLTKRVIPYASFTVLRKPPSSGVSQAPAHESTLGSVRDTDNGDSRAATMNSCLTSQRGAGVSLCGRHAAAGVEPAISALDVTLGRCEE